MYDYRENDMKPPSDKDSDSGIEEFLAENAVDQEMDPRSYHVKRSMHPTKFLGIQFYPLVSLKNQQKFLKGKPR